MGTTLSMTLHSPSISVKQSQNCYHFFFNSQSLPMSFGALSLRLTLSLCVSPSVHLSLLSSFSLSLILSLSLLFSPSLSHTLSLILSLPFSLSLSFSLYLSLSLPLSLTSSSFMPLTKTEMLRASALW